MAHAINIPEAPYLTRSQVNASAALKIRNKELENSAKNLDPIVQALIKDQKQDVKSVANSNKIKTFSMLAVGFLTAALVASAYFTQNLKNEACKEGVLAGVHHGNDFFNNAVDQFLSLMELPLEENNEFARTAQQCFNRVINKN